METEWFLISLQMATRPMEKSNRYTRGTWSVAVLNVPWKVIVVIVASVDSKQINLVTCCRKHQRKTMRKFYVILIVLCNFQPHKSFNFSSEDSALEVHMWWTWGREDLLVSPPGFPLWVDFSENTWVAFFSSVFYRSFKWSPCEKWTLLRTAQQVIGKYFNSPARTLQQPVSRFCIYKWD